MTARQDRRPPMIVEVNCRICAMRDVYEFAACWPDDCRCGLGAHKIVLEWCCSRCGANNLKGHTP